MSTRVLCEPLGSLAKAELLRHFSGTSVGSVLDPGLQPWGDTEADPSPV